MERGIDRVSSGARNLSSFLTGILFGHVVRMVEGGSFRQVWRIGISECDMSGQSFTMRGVGDDHTRAYRVCVLVGPAGIDLPDVEAHDALMAQAAAEAATDEEEEEGDEVASGEEEPLSDEEVERLLANVDALEVARSGGRDLTYNDLARVAWPITDDAGWRGVLSATTATDPQFHRWARSRLGLRLGERPEPWPPERRLSLCRYLYRQRALVLLRAGFLPLVDGGKEERSETL